MCVFDLTASLFASISHFISITGLDPLLPIFQRGILYGTPEIREVSASGLGELLSVTSSTYLAGPLVVKMTGPLLRVVGDRNPTNVKVAILKTLGLILTKGGASLRAFIPQFQTTFVKYLSDPSRLVRVEAIQALSLLIPLSTRVDPLIKELTLGASGHTTTASDEVAAVAVQTAMLEALAVVIEKGGKKAASPTSVPTALDSVIETLHSPDVGIREAAAKVVGQSCCLLGVDGTKRILDEHVLGFFSSPSIDLRHSSACCVQHILETSIGTELSTTVPVLLRNIVSLIKDDNLTVRRAACEALGIVLSRSPDPSAAIKATQNDIIAILQNTKEDIEIHRAMGRGLCLGMQLLPPKKRLPILGVKMVDACLQMALTASQKVQFAFNDVLYVVLDVSNGNTGLETYCDMAEFEKTQAMRSLHSKILTRMKGPSVSYDVV
jgi:hypothetical protein